MESLTSPDLSAGTRAPATAARERERGKEIEKERKKRQESLRLSPCAVLCCAVLCLFLAGCVVCVCVWAVYLATAPLPIILLLIPPPAVFHLLINTEICSLEALSPRVLSPLLLFSFFLYFSSFSPLPLSIFSLISNLCSVLSGTAPFSISVFRPQLRVSLGCALVVFPLPGVVALSSHLRHLT